MGKWNIYHPASQHSHRFAEGLYEAGLLSKYDSGVPVKMNENEWRWLPSSYRRKVKKVSIPPEYRIHNPVWQVLYQVGSRLVKREPEFRFLVYRIYDLYQALKLVLLRPDISGVICFEDSAYFTFRAAKKLGIFTIMDAPSVHPAYGLKHGGYNVKRGVDRFISRKYKEIDFADCVICCSKFSADTYIAGGVDPCKVQVNPLGATVDRGLQKIDSRDGGPIKCIFAGVMSYRKSIDLILRVAEELGNTIELYLVGGSQDSKWIKMASSLGNVRYFGSVSQSELFTLMSECDCLLLPSRYDAFGMVVPEAMASGLAVIVSSTAGAKEILDEYPEAGIVVDAEYGSILDSIVHFRDNPNSLLSSRKAALAASRYYSWDKYRERVAEIVRELDSR